MLGRKQFGKSDHCLCQIYPNMKEEFFGGVPTILFGDFAQLPPVGDTPLYSDKQSSNSLSNEGCRSYESFTHSITLSTVFRQAGQDPEQVAFRNFLICQRDYSANEDDYQLLHLHFWDNLSDAEYLDFQDQLHLLPTKDMVTEYNKC